MVLTFCFLCPTSVVAEPYLLISSFNRVLMVTSYQIHDFSALVTSEALSRFLFQPRSVEDVVLVGLSASPVVELTGETTGVVYFSSFFFFNISLLLFMFCSYVKG